MSSQPAAIDSAAVTAVLADIADPESGRSLVEMGQVRSVEASPGSIAMQVGLTSHAAILWNRTRARIEELLRARFPHVPRIAVEIVPHDRPPAKIGQIEIGRAHV